jgi:hypothetical protein
MQERIDEEPGYFIRSCDLTDAKHCHTGFSGRIATKIYKMSWQVH